MTETPHLGLKFAHLEKAKYKTKNSVPKIQRVAHYLRDREDFAKHYSPRLMSMGPLHHGAGNLQLGETYKLMWAARFLERTKQDAQTLYQEIASNIEQLKELFAEDIIGKFPDDEKLSWMLLVDGCSLLQIMEKGKLDDPKEMNVKIDQLVLVWQDVLLLENQLPYQVLKLLIGPENEAMLLNSMVEFLKCHHLSPVRSNHSAKKKTNHEDSALAEEGYASVSVKNEDTLQGELRIEIPQEPPIHLLDQLRRTVVDDPHQDHPKETNSDSDMITHRNIQELRASGIRLKKSNSRRLKDISFSCGWLYAEVKLPEIIVDDTTAPTFLNLIAYEMCPDFENNYDICSFVAFMDTLIDHPVDVKELRSAGVLLNMLGSDEEVAKLFNTISTDLVPNMKRYSHVIHQIERHYRNQCKTWIALGWHTYFSNPWAIIAFHAAVFALVLTFIQTWYGVHPANAG